MVDPPYCTACYVLLRARLEHGFERVGGRPWPFRVCRRPCPRVHDFVRVGGRGRFVCVGGLVSRPPRNAFIIRQQAVAFSIQATFCIFISWVGSASSQCAPCTRNRIVCAFPIEEQNIVRRARLSRRSKTACRTIFLNIKL